MMLFRRKPSRNALLAEELRLTLTSAEEKIHTLQEQVQMERGDRAALEVQVRTEREARKATEMELFEANEHIQRLQESLDKKDSFNKILTRDAITTETEAINLRAQNAALQEEKQKLLACLRERDNKILILQDVERHNVDLKKRILEQTKEMCQQSALSARELEAKEKANLRLQREDNKQKKRLQKQKGKVLTLQEKKAALRKEMRRMHESSEAFILQQEQEAEEKEEQETKVKLLQNELCEEREKSKDLNESLSSMSEAVLRLQCEKQSDIDTALKLKDKDLIIKDLEQKHKEVMESTEKKMAEFTSQMVQEIENEARTKLELQRELCKTRKDCEEQKQKHEQEIETLKEACTRSITEAKIEAERTLQHLKTENEAWPKGEESKKELEEQTMSQMTSLKTALEQSQKAEANTAKKLTALKNELLWKNTVNSQLEKKIVEIAAQGRENKEKLQTMNRAAEKSEEKLRRELDLKNVTNAQLEKKIVEIARQGRKLQKELETTKTAFEKSEEELRSQLEQKNMVTTHFESQVKVAMNQLEKQRLKHQQDIQILKTSLEKFKLSWNRAAPQKQRRKAVWRLTLVTTSKGLNKDP